jgi:HEAT repeat protein
MADGSATADLIARLGTKISRDRRRAAKGLRRLRDPTAGPALLAALQKEIQDPRAWETQYQLIMAVGESGYRPAVPNLWALAGETFEATMVYVAIGDAIVRLGRETADDAAPVLAVMKTGNPMLIDGAFRAVAMMRLRLNPPALGGIIDYAASLAPDHYNRFWVAAAAPGWEHPKLAAFLAACAVGPREDVRKAARAAQEKRYLTWRPL